MESPKSISESNSLNLEPLGLGFLNPTVDLDRPCAAEGEAHPPPPPPNVLDKLQNLSVNGSGSHEGSGNSGQDHVDVFKETVTNDDGGGGEENGQDHVDLNEKKGGGSEENDQSLVVNEFDRDDDDDDEARKSSVVHYPVRPDAEDCAFYMRTGSCKFGWNCKFNHPVRRKVQVKMSTFSHLIIVKLDKYRISYSFKI